MREQRKLAAIMFTDISGYSKMMAKDEKLAMEILRKNRNIHKSAIAKYNGEYIKEIGDGTLAIFQSSLDAVNCAFKILKSCCKESSFAVRIGIHIGDIIYKDGDVFGDGVNIASRIEASGQPGGIFISERVYEDIKNKSGIRAKFYGQKMLKNIPDPVNIFKVLTEGEPQDKGAIRKKIRIKTQHGPRLKQKAILKYSLPFLFILLIATLWFYKELFQKDRKELFSSKGEISVVVMPFQNLTNDASRNFWEVMIQDNLINSLSNVRELKIRQTESILALLDNTDLSSFASLTPSMARSVSQKLDANVFVHGSINQVGNVTRLNAKLIDSKTEEVFKSFQINGSPKNILYLTDSLSLIIRDYLIAEILKKEIAPIYRHYFEQTTSPDALFYFIKGQKSFRKKNWALAREMYLNTLKIDSSFVIAMAYLGSTYGNQGLYTEAKKWSEKAYGKRNNLSRKEKLIVEVNHAIYFETPNEVIIYNRQQLEIDDQNALAYYLIGLSYNWLGQYDKAIPAFEKALEIHDKWGIKPLWSPNYTLLGISYHKTGQYRKEQRLYKEADKYFPDDPDIISRQAILALARGKTKQAKEYLEKFESIIKDAGASEALIQTRLGWIYEEAGMTDKAEDRYRKAFLLEPENIWRMANLAYLLIKQELNVDEGMELIERGLALQPENFYFLHARGLGLYKKGKYQEAHDVLQKSWDLRRELAIYDHEAYLNLEEARKAVAGMK